MIVDTHDTYLIQRLRLEWILDPEPGTEDRSWRHNIVGWLELNHGFFFFTDRAMFERVCDVFQMLYPPEKKEGDNDGQVDGEG